MSCIVSTRARSQCNIAISIVAKLETDGPLPPELPSAVRDNTAASLQK